AELGRALGVALLLGDARRAVAGDHQHLLEVEVLVGLVEERRQSAGHHVHAAGVVAAQEAVPAAQLLLAEAAAQIGAQREGLVGVDGDQLGGGRRRWLGPARLGVRERRRQERDYH